MSNAVAISTVVMSAGRVESVCTTSARVILEALEEGLLVAEVAGLFVVCVAKEEGL